MYDTYSPATDLLCYVCMCLVGVYNCKPCSQLGDLIFYFSTFFILYRWFVNVTLCGHWHICINVLKKCAARCSCAITNFSHKVAALSQIWLFRQADTRSALWEKGLNRVLLSFGANNSWFVIIFKAEFPVNSCTSPNCLLGLFYFCVCHHHYILWLYVLPLIFLVVVNWQLFLSFKTLEANCAFCDN